MLVAGWLPICCRRDYGLAMGSFPPSSRGRRPHQAPPGRKLRLKLKSDSIIIIILDSRFPSTTFRTLGFWIRSNFQLSPCLACISVFGCKQPARGRTKTAPPSNGLSLSSDFSVELLRYDRKRIRRKVTAKDKLDAVSLIEPALLIASPGVWKQRLARSSHRGA